MIIDCDVSISHPHSTPNRYSQAKIGIGFNKKDHCYYLVIVRNKQNDRFRLNASNFVIRAETFIITNPKKMIMLKNIDYLAFDMFKRLAEKIRTNYQPLPAVPSVETILQCKLMPRCAVINNANQIKKLDNPILVNVKIEHVETLRLHHIDKLWSLKKLSELTITGCNLIKIPFALNRLKHLAHLNLSNNQIEEIPMWFTQEMRQLKTINLSHNRLRLIPYEIIGLKKCHILDFHHNLIEHFPSSLLYQIIRFPFQYSKIDFSNNFMRAFPFANYQNFTESESQCIFKIDSNPWKEQENYSFERYPFDTKTLYEKCLEIVFMNLKLKEKLFDHRQTPKQIYDHLQRVLFICNQCGRLKLRMGTIMAELSNNVFVFANRILNENIPRYRIICHDCFI
ncbi:hypothetical protein DERP_000508 [Dermatophagoides pteronyssinus]|uniref:Uncharacterized protein n=1 Tax=Dermatophagoides pteronyssinus TaxID=6956 RepID=A0ABQ8J0E7_DERPT|nr:hypothetical protein DERP_000508 [Dermatophagoides pteronyssinus]